MNKVIALLLLSVSLSVPAASLTLSETVARNFDVQTTTASSVTIPQQWPVSVTVLDAAPLLSNAAELSSARVAAQVSVSELKRVQALQQADNNVALKVVEAARAQASADQSKVQVLQAQLLSDWGRAISTMSPANIESLTQRLLSGQAVLARAEPTSTVKWLAQAVQLHTDAAPQTIRGRLLGGMPQTQANAMRAYLLLLESADADWQTGTMLNATLQGAASNIVGISVPRAAIVRWQGQNWVYVQTGNHEYQRKAVSIQQWLQQSALLASGVNSGEAVVSTGAGLLLGAELSPPEEADAE